MTPTRTGALRRLVVIGAAAVGLCSGAAAAPLAPIPFAPSLEHRGSAAITAVRGGCGFGEHRGPFGGCRINRGIRGRIRAAETGLPGGCPPAMHRGLYGRCRY